MDLLALTTPAVGVVNPFVPMAWRASTGNTTARDGRRTPTYADPVTLMGQVQPLTWRDLQQLEGLNIQGSTNSIYFEGHQQAVVRSANKGGDTVTDSAGVVWLITQVLEFWPDWTKVAVTMQNGS